VIAHARQWLAARSERERRLLALAAVVTVAIGVAGAALAVRDDLARLRARVAAHERELAAVRRLAAAVAGTRPSGGDGGALMTRVQTATDAARLGDRVAAMTPSGGSSDARLAVRLSGASLAEVVHLLHALDEAAGPLGVERLGLRKQPDDPRRFDVTLEIAGGGS
jgi:hypothetical protein